MRRTGHHNPTTEAKAADESIASPFGTSAAWGISAGLTVIWSIVVVSTGLVSRVLHHWESTVTMLAGSFLAGSSPEGGGAVAFPVFTKALHVHTPVARSFGLTIQAVGMTVASASILLNRRAFHRRSAVLGSMAATLGFLLAVVLLGDHDTVFWPPVIGSGWVKATFSIVLATTSVAMVRHLRHGPSDHVAPRWTRRHDIGLLAAALSGGALSSLTGTGANILIFLFLVVLADINPKEALPSAIIVMTSVSVAGLVLFGLFDGQLSVEVSGDRVVRVGDRAVDLVADHADLLGLWLAAVPVVVWGAPLGSLVASRVRESVLVRFIAVLAAVEVLTTFVLVPDLRRDPALIAYLSVGLVVAPAGLIALRRHRERIFLGTASS